MHLLDRIIPLLMIVIIGGSAFIYFLLRGRTNDFASKHATEAPAAARWTDTLLLAALAFGLLLFTQLIEHVGGYFPRLDEIVPDKVALYWSLIGLTVVLIGFGLAAAWRGYVKAATAGLALVVCLYGAFFNNMGGIFMERVGPWASPRTAQYTLNLTDSNHGGAEIEGVDVWLNGQHLGKTPIVTTVEEIMKLVPTEMEEPAEDDYGRHEDAIQQLLAENPDKHYHRGGWVRFQSPSIVDGDFEWVEAYVQVELDGMPGFSGGGSGGGGGGGEFSTNASVYFPNRDDRIEQLLDWARLHDYDVNEAWLTSMGAFNDSGLKAVQSKFEREPDFRRVYAAMTGLNIDLPADPWAEFQKIMAQVDEAGEYNTDSEIGRRVAWIAPHLNPNQLASYAQAIARRPSFTSFQWGRRGDRVDFGGKMPKYGNGWLSPSYVPPRGFPIAHAIWILDEQLDREAPGSTNPFESKITPELIRWHLHDQTAWRAAEALGGPAYDEFALKQNWRTDADDLHYPDRIHLGAGVHLNRWFWKRLNWPGEQGREFRKSHRSRLYEVAEELLDWSEDKALDLIFIDVADGDRSIPEGFWKRYKAATESDSGSEPPKQWFKYLVRMQLPKDELKTRLVRAFTELSANREHASWIGNGFRELDPLPDEIQIEILRELRNQSVQIGNTLADRNRDKNLFSTQLPGDIDRQLRRLGDPEAVKETIANPREFRNFQNWIREYNQDHFLLADFAKHENAEARAFVIEVAEMHPTPRNRTLIEQLKNDEDARVAGAYKKAEATFAEIRSSLP